LQKEKLTAKVVIVIELTTPTPKVRVARPAAEAQGLSKTYPNGTVALRNLTLSVGEGEVFGLLGPNGAGKSTSIGILTTLLRPTAGDAYVAGIDVQRDPLGVRSRIGVVFQDSVLDNEFTVAENLLLHARLWGMAPDVARDRIAVLLGQLGLADRAGHGVRTLSGGLRRRVEIARGMLASPRVLFLDEPTVGLDPTVRAEIWRLIGAIREADGVTVILTTHYLEEAESVCDRVGILHRGSLVAFDAPETLIERLGRWVIELRVSAAAGLLDAVGRERIADHPPLVVGDVVSVTSNRARDDLASVVGRLQRDWPAVTAAAVRPTTLSDVYHHLTRATAQTEESDT
jgi:ABC-2 type transport system ATP-binding protein